MFVFLIIDTGQVYGGGKLDIRAYRERGEAEKKHQELREQIHDETIFHNEDRLILIECHVAGSDSAPQSLLDRAKVRLLLKKDCSKVTADGDPDQAVQAFSLKSDAKAHRAHEFEKIITVNPWPIMAYAVVTTVNGMFSNLNGYVTREAAYKDCDNMRKHSAETTARLTVKRGVSESLLPQHVHEVYPLELMEQAFYANV